MAVIDYDRASVAAAHVQGANIFGALAIAGLFACAYQFTDIRSMELALGSSAAGYLSQLIAANAEVTAGTRMRIGAFVMIGAAVAFWALGVLRLFA